MSVGRRLAAALARSARAAGADLTIMVTDGVFWASGLFEGERHVLAAFGTPCPAVDAWIAALPALDLPLAGHYVEDILVVARGRDGDLVSMTIEALTIVQVD